MTILSHSNHWKSWIQSGDFVICGKCDIVLYKGEAPTNTKTILECLNRDFLNTPITEEQKGSDMPMRVVDPDEVPNDYDGDYMPVEDGHVIVTENVPANAQHNEVATIVPLPHEAKSYVIMESTYSRSIRDPNVINDPKGFGSITASFKITEAFPGEMQAEDIVGTVEAQFVLLKQTVLKELGLPFSQDDATLRIMETFPGSTVVASSATAPTAPAVAPSPGPAGPRATTPAPAGPQASAGPRGPASQASAAVPSTAEMWRELADFPGKYWWNQNKPAGSPQPDFLSTEHYKANARGEMWPVGLWMEYQGKVVCPILDVLETMPGDVFAQTRPGRRN